MSEQMEMVIESFGKSNSEFDFAENSNDVE